MSKTDIYSKALYPSITEGIRTVMKPYCTSDEDEIIFSTYSSKGLEEALAFLCFNNIPHGYAKNKAVITLNYWGEDGLEHYMCWFEEEDEKEISYYLLSYVDNWADEFDVEGFIILTEEQVKTWKKALEMAGEYMSRGHTYEFYFGTNEWIDYSNIEDFRVCFKLSKISDNEVAFIRNRLLGRYASYGIIPTIEDIKNWIHDIKVDEE